ncbi:uncharacterized protein KY384_004250 [Bacidia gigantensis]|uniref:uncharacterized protein n=1 Tax=Bacidia gigantensis TaxID=2732470 RepID=UPI001D0513AA|nr:uncharacterized protein KY384_004250 [Bacidia gigantensis]KAG8530893.1 hypothetical protein KY384_004250 [Bacidia gigantensis]
MPKVPGQGGIIDGANPSHYEPKNPIILFIIQAGIIIIFCRLLHLPLQKIRQPRVIAEVIGGILLGPSVMGRVPGFSAAIFPTASMPVLNMAANLGLILFLFLIGLEVDLRLLLSNWRIALSVGLAGMALPFGLGCAIAYGLYHQFRTESDLAHVSFGTYMLFIGVAMAITAFPVLCRILTELKLLGTQVGVIVLSAGVGNDVVGWILLALSVALVNAGSGITALYVLLTCAAYVLFLVYLVRPGFLWVLRRTGSIQNGPTQSIVGLTVLLVLASAFFTGIIGVHPIFGAFLVGLICPHDGGFAIKLTEKIEDLVTVFFLPLYFALSGLSTNLGLLNNGITWAYVVGVIACAFFGKLIGGTLAARANNLLWRESFTIGTLMSCKGLVELIVLNIGLQAKLLSTRTFTIFVVMALVTTFATTPLTTFLFPPSYQRKLAAWKRGEIDWDGKPRSPADSSDAQTGTAVEDYPGNEVRRLLVALRLESLPSIFTFVDLLGGEKTVSSMTKVHPSIEHKAALPEQGPGDGIKLPKRPLQVHGLRMFDLTERLSSVMRDYELDDWSARDPVVNAFHTFGQLHNVAVSGQVQLVPENQHADIVAESATARHSDMVLIPWSETGSVSEIVNPGLAEPLVNGFSHPTYNHFVDKLLSNAPCSTAIFVNNGFGALRRQDSQGLYHKMSAMSLHNDMDRPTAPLANRSHHIFLPFYGGLDDQVALRFALRLTQNPNVTATFVHVRHKMEDSTASSLKAAEPSATKNGGVISLSKMLETTAEEDAVFLLNAKSAVPEEMRSRILFEEANASDDMVARARDEVSHGSKNAGNLVIVGRRHFRQGLQHEYEEYGVRKTLGETAESMISGNVNASILVIQAGKVNTSL